MARCGCDATFCFAYNISIPSTPIPPLTNKFRGYVAWWCISITNMEPSCIFGGMFNSSNCDGINFSWFTTYFGQWRKPSFVIFLKIRNEFQIWELYQANQANQAQQLKQFFKALCLSILRSFYLRDLISIIFSEIWGMKLHNDTEHVSEVCEVLKSTLKWPRNEEKYLVLTSG